MTDPAKTWSKTLQDTTRRVLEELDFASDPIHLKSIDDRYATLSAADLMAGRLNVVERGTGERVAFEDVEGLIRAGWVELAEFV